VQRRRGEWRPASGYGGSQLEVLVLEVLDVRSYTV
jgi:hypothetical protein